MSTAQATVYRDEYGNEYAVTFIIDDGWAIVCRPPLATAWSIYSGAHTGIKDRLDALISLEVLAVFYGWQAIIPLA